MPSNQENEIRKRIALVMDGHVEIPDSYLEIGSEFTKIFGKLTWYIRLEEPELTFHDKDLPSFMKRTKSDLLVHKREILIAKLEGILNHPAKVSQAIRYIDSLIEEDDVTQTNKDVTTYLSDSTVKIHKHQFEHLIDIRNKLSFDLASRWPTNKNGFPKTYISVRELAFLLGVSKDTIYRKMDAGTLKGEKFGANKGKTLFTVDHVQKMTGV